MWRVGYRVPGGWGGVEGTTVSNVRIWAEEDKTKEREGVETRDGRTRVPLSLRK